MRPDYAAHVTVRILALEVRFYSDSSFLSNIDNHPCIVFITINNLISEKLAELEKERYKLRKGYHTYCWKDDFLSHGRQYWRDY
jgi:hypothetical protein